MHHPRFLRRALTTGVSVSLVLSLAGCASRSVQAPAAPSVAGAIPESVPFRPILRKEIVTPLDLTQPGAVVWRTHEAQVIDTRTIRVDPNAMRFDPAVEQRVRTMLPEHGAPADFPDDPAALTPASMTVGGLMEEQCTAPQERWVSVTSTGWNPPDPTLAVGPNHVVVTVNSRVGFYTKAGVQTFLADLGSQGSPGFFEPVGGSTFCFDPKVFYDHLAQRFVILALEVYNDPDNLADSAWVDIAVSDDSDPNGVWYKYRTDAVVTVGSTTYWWDYPGFGYDQQAYYVTGNLFGLNASGFGGAGFRVFPKAPLLTGGAVTHATFRDSGLASVQACPHHGGPAQAAFFVSRSGSSTIRLHAVRNPLTTPTLTTTSLTVPSFGASVPADTPLGTDALPVIDNRILSCVWRNGSVYATHNIGVGGENVARWYQINTNNWPTSGSPTLVQTGNVDPGPGVDAVYPAIYANASNQVGMVLTVTSLSQNPSVAVCSRRPTDPPGTMSAPVVVKAGEVNTGGRWGDYYGATVDPTDDLTFWVVGEYRRSSGWANWVSSFTLDVPCDSIDFNNDGVSPDTADLELFLFVYGGGVCGVCGDIDFNNDGVAPDTEDVAAFMRVFGGGSCN